MSAGDDLLKNAQVIPLSIWGGSPSLLGTHPMPRPATEGVFIHHTVTKATADPCKDARVVQADLHARGLTGYSWLVHPSGVILALNETFIGEHTVDSHYNTHAFGIAGIGDFSTTPPPETMVAGMSQICLILKRFGWLTAKSPVRPHSAVKATECPGELRPGAMGIIAAVLAQDA